jgi:ABC-type uncharacterized transport system substrate-binding protein
MNLARDQFCIVSWAIRITGVCVCALLLANCATTPVPVVEKPVVVVKPVVVIKPQPVVLPSKVAIVISRDIPNMTSVADALGKRLGEGNYSVHHLQGKPHYGGRVLAEVDAAEADQVVAIGLLAARVLKEHQNRPLVFCQTYNYQEYGLVSDRSKGVSFLPPFDQQFDSWHKLSPSLRTVAVVTGPNQDALLKEIRQAAERKNINVVSRIVTSDKAALHEIKRLMPEVQGVLLLPDNRILSPGVLRQIMSTGAKRRTQIAVYSPSLLNLGALISFAGTPDDIARVVDKRLDAVRADGSLPGPALQSLTKVDMQVNPTVASYLSLAIPKQFAQAQ